MDHTNWPRAIQDAPARLRPAVQRIIDRTRRCAPATPASARLFLERIAEETVHNPHAGPDDAAAARALLDVLHADRASADRMLAKGGQLPLFGEGGER
jgi:hypothetical protein